MRACTSRQLGAVVAVMALAVAAPAWACPVCGLPSEQGQDAYLGMTVVMSLLPLLGLGGLVLWVARRIRAHARAEAQLLERSRAER